MINKNFNLRRHDYLCQIHYSPIWTSQFRLPLEPKLIGGEYDVPSEWLSRAEITAIIRGIIWGAIKQ